MGTDQEQNQTICELYTFIDQIPLLIAHHLSMAAQLYQSTNISLTALAIGSFNKEDFWRPAALEFIRELDYYYNDLQQAPSEDASMLDGKNKSGAHFKREFLRAMAEAAFEISTPGMRITPGSLDDDILDMMVEGAIQRLREFDLSAPGQ